MSARPVASLSHSSSDKQVAQELATELRDLGIGVWIDSERIKYGQSIPRAIEDGLGAPTLCSCWSQSHSCARVGVAQNTNPFFPQKSTRVESSLSRFSLRLASYH